jgi:hypothetical protein
MKYATTQDEYVRNITPYYASVPSRAISNTSSSLNLIVQIFACFSIKIKNISMLDESNLEWLDLEDKLTAENAEYISICIYTYGVYYALRQRLKGLTQ